MAPAQQINLALLFGLLSICMVALGVAMLIGRQPRNAGVAFALALLFAALDLILGVGR